MLHENAHGEHTNMFIFKCNIFIKTIYNIYYCILLVSFCIWFFYIVVWPPTLYQKECLQTVTVYAYYNAGIKMQALFFVDKPLTTRWQHRLYAVKIGCGMSNTALKLVWHFSAFFCSGIFSVDKNDRPQPENSHFLMQSSVFFKKVATLTCSQHFFLQI